MRRHGAYVGLIRSTAVAFALGFAWPSFVLADEPTSPPAPSDQSVQERAVPPVVEGEPAPPPEAGEVQERGVGLQYGVNYKYRLRSNSYGNYYINIEGGPVVASLILPGWLSAMWTLEPVAPGSSRFRIRSVWKPDLYLNIEYGRLEASPTYPLFESAQWTLEPRDNVNGQVRGCILSFWKSQLRIYFDPVYGLAALATSCGSSRSRRSNWLFEPVGG